ncbi:unnamed protein product [Microthlaspi erraticum]|uniref:Uncharacterized protein n=1 Tax=Microthlaspi erraticum TaxID=1685480 RepID=A0A6D2KJ05_9BRAS|nr:unnamed protein product [Microthlaspi erraticum]
MVYTRVGVWIPQCPQRTGRLGRGLEMGDGHQEHSMQLGCSWLTRSSLRLLFLLFFIFKVGVASLALVELGSLEAVNSTLSSIELSFLCLDSIESGGRAGASGLGSLPPSLRVVFSFPWLERRGSVRLLGREPPWVVRSDLLLGKVGALDFFFLLEEPETFFSKLLILLTILSMDFCIFSMAFPCHLLNFWRSPILLWQPQQRGSSLEPHTPQSNSTQAHPNPHSPGVVFSSILSSILSSRLSSILASSSCPTNVYTGGLKSMFSPLRLWLVLQNLMSIQPGSVALLSVGFTPAAHKIGAGQGRHEVPCRSISPDPLAIACA